MANPIDEDEQDEIIAAVTLDFNRQAIKMSNMMLEILHIETKFSKMIHFVVVKFLEIFFTTRSPDGRQMIAIIHNS